MLGSDPLLDALIDLSQRRRRSVELVSRRLWLRLWPLALASSPLALLLSLGRSAVLGIDRIAVTEHRHLPLRQQPQSRVLRRVPQRATQWVVVRHSTVRPIEMKTAPDFWVALARTDGTWPESHDRHKSVLRHP
jgi:hypothetical protein